MTDQNQQQQNLDQSPKAAKHSKKPDALSMHADVPVWHDCCSCEAEPYWTAEADESEEERAGASGSDSEHR